MKTILIIIFSFSAVRSHAQTFEEWSRQKKTQKKYLLEQIAAFSVYIGYAKKGYSIVNNGLSTIQDIKNGDFSLHNDFFKSKSKVNRKVKNYAKVASIIAMQISIAKQIRNTIKNCRKSNQLTNVELDYLKKVFDNVINQCIKNLEELIQLTSDGELKMKDDERLERIDKLYVDMQDKKTFVQAFSNGAKQLAVQRIKEQSDINIQRKLNALSQ